MQWFYAKGGQQAGPVEDQVFHDLVRAGEITADTPVWREGMPNWMPYAQVGGRKPPAAERKKLTLARDGAAEATATAAAASAETVQSESTPAGVTTGSGDVEALIEPLYRGKFWIRLVGIMLIIQGILMVPTIVGLLVAWLPIWMGITLTTVAKQTVFAYESRDLMAATAALDKLRVYFKIMGILTLVGLILGVVFTIAAVAFPALLTSSLLAK